MKKRLRKFGDWSRSDFTIFLEMTAISLSIMLAIKLAGRFL
jgi:hypothetical protein